MNFHALSELFPLMQGREFDELVADVKANGLREPIWVYDGKILDGRNRWRACEAAEVSHRPMRTYEGDDPLGFVISLNLHRRHMTEGQKAALALDVLPHLEEQAHDRMKMGKEKIPDPNSVGQSRDKAAAMVGTNPRYVSDAKRLQSEAPDLLEKVRTGNTNIVQATRELKERKKDERREENRVLVTATADPLKSGAKFATILLDPPWDFGDEGDWDPLGRARPDYHQMSIDQIEKLPVGDLADVDCHLYLWITNRSLPKGFRLFDAWGFRYVTCITWAKPHFGMGNYFRGQTEHVLFGVRGSQVLKRKDVGTLFSAARGPRGHSSKPVEFYDLVESCSPGPYLEMFARSQRANWNSWGAEANAA